MQARSAQGAMRLHTSSLVFVRAMKDCQLKKQALLNLEFFNTIGQNRSFPSEKRTVKMLQQQSSFGIRFTYDSKGL
jgi:hypothetical protein